MGLAIGNYIKILKHGYCIHIGQVGRLINIRRKNGVITAINVGFPNPNPHYPGVSYWLPVLAGEVEKNVFRHFDVVDPDRLLPADKAELNRDLKRADKVFGLQPFHVGEYVIFTADFYTSGTIPEVICPAGTKGKVIATEEGSGATRVDIGGTGDERWVQGDDLNIIQVFEPDVFDRAWLDKDYATARSLWERVLPAVGDNACFFDEGNGGAGDR